MATEALAPVPRCPNCNSESAPDKKFCADCGAPITPADYRQLVHSEVTALLAERLKDRHVAEIEVCESVLIRLQTWAKWFAWVVALPIGLTLAGLTFFGFEKVRDIDALAERVDKEVQPKVESALRDADEASGQALQAKSTATQVTADMDKQLVAARGITSKVESLSAKVAALESQTTQNVNAATTRIEAQVRQVDERVSNAQSQISEQQKKLTDTGELVKAIFTNSRTELFNEATPERYIVREGNNRRVVFMLLKEVPVPQSVQLQWRVYSQPRNSYVALYNVIIFFWADPAESLKRYPVSVSYVADPTAKDKPFTKLTLKEDHVFADSEQLPDLR